MGGEASGGDLMPTAGQSDDNTNRSIAAAGVEPAKSLRLGSAWDAGFHR